MPRTNRKTLLAVAFMAGCFQSALCGSDASSDGSKDTSAVLISPTAKRYSLEECLSIALKNSHRRPASRFGLAMAEAQHRQALSGYWPQVSFKVGYERLDQPMNFLFPTATYAIPSQSISIPGGASAVTIPANAFGPGFPPSTIQMPISYAGQTIQTPAQNFTLPQQNIKILDDNLVSGTVDFKWLLYDGGMRKGLGEQSNGAVDMMRSEVRRTDLEITDSVKRYYWGSVLASQLRQLGTDTLARMEVTLHLTESLYKEGSDKVTKADYLDNKVMVETVRSMLAHLEENQELAEAALANTIGMDWRDKASPESTEIPFNSYEGSVDELVASSYRFNPDWTKLQAGLKAADGAVKTARSSYQPKIALTGEVHRWWNGGYNVGLSTPSNRFGSSVGIGLEIPLFNGFLTSSKLAETRAQISQLKENELLLKDGLGLQVKNLVIGLAAAAKSDEASASAMDAARENCDLNTRAYANGLVDTEKVIRAQLMEALMSAQHYMARYQYAELSSKLGLVVGTEIQNKLAPRR